MLRQSLRVIDEPARRVGTEDSRYSYSSFPSLTFVLVVGFFFCLNALRLRHNPVLKVVEVSDIKTGVHVSGELTDGQTGWMTKA